MPKRPRVNSIPLRKEDYEILAEFRHTLRKFLRFSEEAAGEHRLTPQQYQALLAIAGFPGRDYVSVGELAAQLQIAHHSAVGLVDRMVTAGLVRRDRAGQDRRKVEIHLTDTGLATFQKLYLTHRSELHDVGPRLTALLDRLERHGAA